MRAIWTCFEVPEMWPPTADLRRYRTPAPFIAFARNMLHARNIPFEARVASPPFPHRRVTACAAHDVSPLTRRRTPRHQHGRRHRRHRQRQHRHHHHRGGPALLVPGQPRPARRLARVNIRSNTRNETADVRANFDSGRDQRKRVRLGGTGTPRPGLTFPTGPTASGSVFTSTPTGAATSPVATPSGSANSTCGWISAPSLTCRSAPKIMMISWSGSAPHSRAALLFARTGKLVALPS